MRGNAKRFLSILLAVVIALSLMPESVLALAVYAEGAAAGLCKHHMKHTADCGYGETTPCGYVCKICLVQDLIDALPEADTITAEIAPDVEAQLAGIDKAKEKLTDEELDGLGTARYEAAVTTLLSLEDMAEADQPKEPEPLAEAGADIAISTEEKTGGPTRTTVLNVSALTETTDMTETEGWKWDISSKTLTLKDCYIKTEETKLLRLTDTVTIVLEGDNILETTGTRYSPIIDSSTIHCDITIRGEGSLSILQSSEQKASSNPYGIFANTITVESGTIDTNVPFCSISEAFTFKGGSLTIDSRAITSMDAIYAHGGDITISGGEMNIRTGLSGLYVPGQGAGPDEARAIIINGGTVNIEEGQIGLDANTINISGDAKVHASTQGDKWPAIRALAGPLAIGGSAEVTVSSTGSYGLYTPASGEIVISDSATVTAIGGKAGIGGAFSTGQNSKAFVVASSISDTSKESEWSGIIFNGTDGKVYGGDYTLTANATISSGATLTVPSGTFLTIAESAALTNNGTIMNEGTLTINGGALIGGTEGCLSGSGSFLITTLTEDIITVPADLVYNGKDRTEEIKAATNAVTICGQTFRISGWTQSVRQVDDLEYAVTYTPDDGGKAISITVIVAKSGTDLTATLKDGKTEYAYADFITINATVTLSGEAANAPAMLTASLTEPKAGQVAVYEGNTQVSEPQTPDADGACTFTIPAKELEDGNHTLTVKYIETTVMAEATLSISVKVDECPHTSMDGSTGKCTVCQKYIVVKGTIDSGQERYFVSLSEAMAAIAGHAAKLEITQYYLFAQDFYGELHISANTSLDLSVSPSNPKLPLKSIEVGQDATLRLDCPTDIVSLGSGGPFIKVYGTLFVDWLNSITKNKSTETLHVYPTGKVQNIVRITLDGVTVENGTIMELIQEGIACKKEDGTWYTDEELSVETLSGIVKIVYIPVKITGQPTTPVTVEYGYTTAPTLTVTAVSVYPQSITYQWLDEDGNTISGATSASYSPTGLDAGTYTYSCNVTCDNYTLKSNAMTVTVNRKPLTITANDQTITYGGSIAQGTGQVETEGLVSGHTLEGIALTASSSEVEAENKTITPSAAVIRNGGTDVSANYDINYVAGSLAIEYFKGEIPVTFNGKGLAAVPWLSPADQVAISASGFTIAAADGSRPSADDFKDSVTIPAGEVGGKAFCFKQDGTGYMTDGIRYTLKVDDTPPSGRVGLGYKWWEDALSFLSFGHYRTGDRTVSIEAEDGGSGVQAIEYAIVEGDAQYTTIDGVKAAGLAWTAYDSANRPAIDLDTKAVIYAKLTDKVGNSVFISSGGILLDETAPVVNGLKVVEGSVTDRQAQASLTVDEAATAYLVAVPKAEADKMEVQAADVVATCDMDAVGAAGGSPVAEAEWHGTLDASEASLTAAADITGLTPLTEYTVYAVAVDKVIDMDATTDAGSPVYTGNVSAVQAIAFTTQKGALQGSISFPGTPVYGGALTAGYDISTQNHGSLSFQWYRIGEDGTEVRIDGATTASYTPAKEDIGCALKLKITASNCTGALEQATRPVQKADCPAGNNPTGGQVDDGRGADTFTFRGSASVAYEYSLDGGSSWTDISTGSDGAGTIPVGNVALAAGKVQVRAKETEVYKAGEAISNDGPFTATLEGSVSLTGTAVYNGTLTAEVSGAQEGAVLAYSFYRNDGGAKIPVQTGSSNTYVLKAEDIGKAIHVEVAAEGYAGGLESAATDAVQKAPDAPGMPGAEMEVPYSCDTVGKAALPDGWEWEDKDKELPVGTATVATAVYIGADRGSYEHETAVIRITRADCAHTWDDGTVTKEPTAGAEGERTYTCTRCGATRIEGIPKLPSDAQDTTDGQPTKEPEPGEGESPDVEQQPDESGQTGDQIAARKDLPLLLATGRQKGERGIRVAWRKVGGSSGYEVYWSYCGGKQKFKKLKTVKGSKGGSLTHKNLKKGRAYKYYVAAYRIEGGRKRYVAKSPEIHVAMRQEKRTNAKSIKVNKESLKLKAKKSFQIKARTVAEDRKKKLLSHAAEFRYYTDDKEVATVTKKGKVKAKKKGTCTIYVIANNGASKKIKVTVK